MLSEGEQHRASLARLLDVSLDPSGSSASFSPVLSLPMVTPSSPAPTELDSDSDGEAAFDDDTGVVPAAGEEPVSFKQFSIVGVQNRGPVGLGLVFDEPGPNDRALRISSVSPGGYIAAWNQQQHMVNTASRKRICQEVYAVEVGDHVIGCLVGDGIRTPPDMTAQHLQKVIERHTSMDLLRQSAKTSPRI